MRSIADCWRMGQEIRQDAARIVDQVAKALGYQNPVDVSRRWLFHLFQVVIWQGFRQGYLNSDGWLVLVWGNAHGHRVSRPWRDRATPKNAPVCSKRNLHCLGPVLLGVGATREDGKSPVNLLCEHDARQFVRIGQSTER